MNMLSRKEIGLPDLLGNGKTLKEHRDEVLERRRPGLLLAGAAGVGKSRLVSEAIDRAAERSWATVHLPMCCSKH